MAFSILAIGLPNLSPADFRGHEGDPVALIAEHIPIIGVVAAPLTAVIGFLIVYISANSGVVSSSRLSYSMSQFDLLPAGFSGGNSGSRRPPAAFLVLGRIAWCRRSSPFLPLADL